MDIHYYKQERTWTCGAASMRMALSTLGIKKSEKQLIRLLGLGKGAYTRNNAFPKLAEKYKLNYIVQRNSTLEDMKKLREQGYVIIVAYFYRPHNVGHFAVLRHIGEKTVDLLDPWVGPEHRYSINTFKKIWRSGFEKDKRWFIAIKPNGKSRNN